MKQITLADDEIVKSKKYITKKKTGILYENIKDFRKNKIYYLLTVPAILFFTVFHYLPMAGIVLAFKNYKFDDGIFGSEWVGLQNFKFFFLSEYAFTTTFNTIFLNFMFILFGTLCQVCFALLLNEIKEKFFKKIFQSFMLFPYFISWVVISNFVYSIFSSDFGVINNILKDLGMSTVNWYSNASYWPTILVFTYIWKWTGYGVIIYLAVIAGIDSELYESSCIDGANKFQQIKHITIPHLTNIVIILTLLAVGRIFYGDFGMIYGIIQDNGVLFKTTDVIDTYVFRALRGTGDIGMASAVGLYQSVVGFALVIISNMLAKKYNKDAALF